MARLIEEISLFRWMHNKSPCVYVLGSQNSEDKISRENIVRPFSVSVISSFLCEKNAKAFFSYSSAEMWFSPFVHEKDLCLRKLIWKSGNFCQLWLPHETTFFWRKSEKAFHFSPTGAAVAHFLWQVLITFGKTYPLPDKLQPWLDIKSSTDSERSWPQTTSQSKMRNRKSTGTDRKPDSRSRVSQKLKILISLRKDEIAHKIIVSEEQFLCKISFPSSTEILQWSQ